jgi:hypothetical protein
MYKPTNQKKSAGEQFAENLMYFSIAMFILWVLTSFIAFLFAPFMFVSEAKMAERIQDEFEKKLQNRKRRQEKYDADETDPMHLILGEKQLNAEDQAYYYAWLQEWTEGKIIDTWMKWAPAVESPSGKISERFLQYVGIQMELHQKASALTRLLFLQNIRHCYPELTPTMKGLERDLAMYGREVVGESLRSEFHTELGKYGLCPELEAYIESASLTPAKLKKAIKCFKECMEHEYTPEVSILIFEEDLNPASDSSKSAYHIMTRLNLGRNVCMRYFKGELNVNDIKSIYDEVESLKANAGDALYEEAPEGGNYYYQCIENLAEEIISKRKLAKMTKKGA